MNKYKVIYKGWFIDTFVYIYSDSFSNAEKEFIKLMGTKEIISITKL